MNRRTLPLIGLISLILIAFILSAGCAGDRTASSTGTSPRATPPPALGAADLKGCTALGGDVCQAGEECTGGWLPASDSFACCSKPCISAPSAVLTIEPFDTLQENEELGDIL